MIPSSAAPKNKWHTTCLGVLTEPWLLIKSIICPCNAYKEAVESLVEEDVGCLDSVFGGVCLLCGFDLRVRFRETLNLEGNPTEDFCMHVFCHCCSLVQMKRESKYWADYIPKKRPVRPRMGIPHETFQGFPEVVSNQPRPAPPPRREPMSPTPVFHSMNVDVVTVSPDVSEITRVESPSEERNREQNQEEMTSYVTLTANDLADLERLDIILTNETRPQNVDESPGPSNRVINSQTLEELRK